MNLFVLRLEASTHEQAAAAWNPVYRRPFWPSLSILGVLISEPKQPQSEKPKSSATIIRKLGRAFRELAMLQSYDKYLIIGMSLF